MRIRLRVPTDDEENSKIPRGWLQRIRDSFLWPNPATRVSKSRPCPTDKRWSVRGESKYYLEGRHCRRIDGNWESEYVFSIFAKGELKMVRVVVPESPVAEWERKHDQRMSEEQRLHLARESVEALVDLQRFPAAITVPASTIAAAPDL
ncbi:MAG: hypothetical protein ABIO24_09070 [Saprospiraceae bacterium]